MKKLNFYLLFMLTTVILNAQVVKQNDVVASAGATLSSTNLKIDYTLGEPVIELASASNISASQGFHQPELYATAIEESQLEDLRCYPNPVSENLILEIPASYTNSFEYFLSDINGKIMTAKTVYSGSNIIEMKSFAAGEYLLKVIEPESGKTFESEILKIK